MATPVVTLLSDFGERDTFVGQMKGIVLSYCADATLVDLTHLIPAQSIFAGALHLGAAWRSFPPRAIHLAVVDPGVGSERRPLAVSFGNHTFVLPDNGLISGVLGGESPERVIELAIPKDANRVISRTFHGRDIFAPAAGHLAAGLDIESLGEEVHPDSIVRLEIPTSRVDGDSVVGEILFIDHFGNAITNITRADVSRFAGSGGAVACGWFRAGQISSRYQDVEPASPVALVSSMDTLELAVREGSASSRYSLQAGMIVTVHGPGITSPNESEKPGASSAEG